VDGSEYSTKPVDIESIATALWPPGSRREPGTVLVVDDDAITREILRRTLVREGWRVIEAENGRSALKVMRDELPSVVMLDLRMPSMDGFEFVIEARKNPRLRAIPIMVTTARDLTLEDRRKLQNYVVRILQKGTYSRAELLRDISQLVTPSLTQMDNDAS
jgi:CheY-like chemotaxis protein